MRTRVFLFLLLSTFSTAQTKPVASRDSAEARTAKRMEAVRNEPPALRAFLLSLPKGGDLHNHLSGSIYAENYILWAAQMKLCVEKTTLTYVQCKDEPGVEQAQRKQRSAA